ncbi:MAG TPA: pilus assembly protein TadG-related protein [Candidatus Limnocylindrales bacterium]|jgi:Flp pilus assembly protein TadG
MSTKQGGRDDGQMLVIFAICLVAIIAMTGLVIDGGMTFVQRREQQNVADAAALAGAYAYVNSNNASDAGPAAMAAAAANGYTSGSDGVTVSVTTAVTGGAIKVTTTVTRPHRNYFSGIVGFTSWPVTTTATAQGGMPNGALGAMPVLFNKKAFPVAVGKYAEMSFDEPGVGTPDVPQQAGQFNWTVYCTASGNTCNGDSNTVDSLIHSHGHSTLVTLNDAIGPLNAGAHATLFSDLADFVGKEFPVAIVDDGGHLQGWAIFHLTGSVGGSTKQIRGYFESQINHENLKIVQGGGNGLNLGDVPVRLTN